MKKILVINNDFDTMELLQRWLEKKAYKVKYMGNEDEIIDTVNDFKPDLVIADVLKERAVTKLKSSEKTKKIPIVLMTGYTISPHTHTKEADAIIEKPFDPLHLENVIKDCLKKTG